MCVRLRTSEARLVSKASDQMGLITPNWLRTIILDAANRDLNRTAA